MQTAQFAEFELSRLMLGTVQLGLAYGIANRLGQPSYEDARDMIAAAWECGVNCLDTAAGYGTSEEVIGRALAELGLAGKITIVSKVIQMADGLSASDADAIVEESFTRSLQRLRLGSLPICMFHIESNFLEYSDSLLRLKDKGLVRHVGTSANFPDLTAEVIGSGQAEAVQLPTSVLDQRFVRGKIIREGASRGVAVFVRSIYLQGLLFVPEEDILPELAEVIPVRLKLASLAADAGIGLAELAVRYLLGVDGITCLVVGAESVEQIRENARLVSKGPLDPALTRAVSEAVPDLPESILFPRRWSKRMPDARPVGQ
jgi:aryl-alcohol dehydrogenase-like predicted oxidoreductase